MAAALLVTAAMGTEGAVAAAAHVEPGASATPADGEPDGGEPVAAVRDGWVLAWSDEFEGPAGSPPDAATWGYDLGDGSAIGLAGWGNDERERYTDEAANVVLDGAGHLVISARVAEDDLACYYGPCEYTSARLLLVDYVRLHQPGPA